MNNNNEKENDNFGDTPFKSDEEAARTMTIKGTGLARFNPWQGSLFPSKASDKGKKFSPRKFVNKLFGSPSSSSGLSVPEFTIIVAGDSGAGKTEFSKNMGMCAGIETTYSDEISQEGVSSFLINTDRGRMKLRVLELNGTDHIRKIYNFQAKGAVILFDLTSRSSHGKVSGLHSKLGKIPMVLCGTNSDNTEDRKVKKKDVILHRKHKMPYFEIDSMSVSTSSSSLQPIQALARKLSGWETLEIIPPSSDDVEEGNLTELGAQFSSTSLIE